jgi:hypothetical protein
VIATQFTVNDRALRGTTDWTHASIVLDLAEQAKILLFGARS